MAGQESRWVNEELISEKEVDKRIRGMAGEITELYAGKNPLFVAFLKGAMPFASKLMFSITEVDPDFHPEIDYMIISTYTDANEAREPRIVTDIAGSTKVDGRHVVMLDDLLDTGRTAAFADGHFRSLNASDVDLVTLVEKTSRRPLYPGATIYGFDAPADEWLTGMGMDNPRQHNEANRWAGSISIARCLTED